MQSKVGMSNGTTVIKLFPSPTDRKGVAKTLEKLSLYHQASGGKFEQLGNAIETITKINELEEISTGTLADLYDSETKSDECSLANEKVESETESNIPAEAKAVLDDGAAPEIGTTISKEGMTQNKVPAI